MAKIKIDNIQLKLIVENTTDEGINIEKPKFQNYSVMSFNPKHNQLVDDKIFNETGNFNVRKITLPKSNIVSYNLFHIKSNKFNKALKHGVTPDDSPVVYDINSMRLFMKRIVEYMRAIIGNRDVDIITCPQSSSDFNSYLVKALAAKYPSSKGIKALPELLVKNINNIKVNVAFAKQLGLDDKHIRDLQNRVEKWKKDEQVRNLRLEIIQLKNEIANYIANRKGKKGRFPGDIDAKYSQIFDKGQQIRTLKKGFKGRDSTFIDSNTVKPWQIKSLDNNDRLSIENIFEINPNLLNAIKNLVNKTVIIIDDNISSGATLDDACITLKKAGVTNIIPFTLGTMDQTHYDRSAYR